MARETVVALIEEPEYTDRETELNDEVTAIERTANEFVIKCSEDYAKAGEFGSSLKKQMSVVKEFWKPMKEAAHKAHSEICSKEKQMLKPLENAETALKKTMRSYMDEQDRIRRKIEEEQKRLAQLEIEKKMQQAIELESSGKKEEAAAAFEEAEIIDDVTRFATVQAPKPKTKGVSARKDWEITGMDLAVVPDMVNGVLIRPVDTSAVMKLIRSSNGTVRINGISYKEKVIIGFRK